MDQTDARSSPRTSDILTCLHRLRPAYAVPSRYLGRASQSHLDPSARTALARALRSIEIHAERFLRRDLIEAARQVALPDMTVFRIAADLQRLVLRRVGLMSTSPRLDRGGPELTSSTALAIRADIALEVDDGLGGRVVLLARREALGRVAGDAARHLVLSPDHRSRLDVAARIGVEAVLTTAWIATMDRALAEAADTEPLRRSWTGRTVVADKADVLPNVDVLLILEICRRLSLELILVDDIGRFPSESSAPPLIFHLGMPALPGPDSGPWGSREGRGLSSPED